MTQPESLRSEVFRDHASRPAVVLADASPGGEFDVLQALLEQALGLSVVRIRSVGSAMAAVSLNLEQRCLTIGGQRIQPTVAWVRHASAAAIYAHQLRTTGVDRHGLQGAECKAKLLGLVTAVAGASLPGPVPEFARQLVDADKHGIRVPRTVVGTDGGAAMQMLSVQRAVVKIPDARLFEQRPNTPGSCTPWVVGPNDDMPEWMDGEFPAVIQEYVAHVKEQRVYYIDGGVCAFDVDKPTPASLWTESAQVTVRFVRCPEHLANMVLTLARAWGLRYGAFDFLITDAHEPVFLEVNADGDWLWYERKAGTDPVSFMVAAMVAELSARVAQVVGGFRAKVV